MARHASPSTEFLTGPPDVPVVYLLDAASDLEVSMLTGWLRSELGHEPETIRITSARRGRGGDTQGLADLLASSPEHFLIPARVVWLAPQQNGRRSVTWFDLLRLGDARDPKPLRSRWIRLFRPGRVRLIAARGATGSEMTSDYETSGQLEPLTSYVIRRAWLVLDRAERRLRGNRYKIPRFVPEAILSRREFVEAVSGVARGTGMPDVVALEKAERYLREIAATHSPHVIDLIANAIHKLYSQGYSEIRYSEADVHMIAGLAGQTVVFLPSHRSNLDRLSLQFMLWENDLPPNHTAGGINLNFFPVGPLLRRTGVFFIRRTFKDNPLYRTVLRAYIDYLVEKRFPLEWYMEGGRSRSGKLLPPRLGLLSYVVDAYRRGKAEEIQLVPVSIAYDQIQDVPDYAREAQGKAKEKESIGWLLRAIRSLRRRYGDIHIRFAEPVAVSSVIGSIEGDDESSVGLQKLAFEVMYRIGRVTPVTPTALVSVALLAARGAARSTKQLEDESRRLIGFIEARDIPTTEVFEKGHVGPILDWLSENGYVSQHEALERKVFWLDEDQMIRISYYRNMIAHYFVNRAMAEIALRAAEETSARDVETIEASMLDLRDLLKFEFFFPEKEKFLREIDSDISIDVPDWAGMIENEGPQAVLGKLGDPIAHWSVLPFLDAYQVVGDELEATRGRFDEKSFLKACLDRARMYRIEERLISGESASQVLFKSALALAKNRDLIVEGPESRRRRIQFAAEVRSARRLAAAGL